MITCPSRQSENIKFNGHIHNSKQNHLCKNCARQFVLNPDNKVITAGDKAIIDRLLLEKISLAGLARTIEVSQVWLQGYLSDLLEDKFDEYVLYHIAPLQKTLIRLSVDGQILKHLNRT